MFSIKFWSDAFERLVKSAAQAVLTGFTIGEGFNVFDVDLRLALGFAGGGAAYSLLTSIASAPFGSKDGSASLVK